MSISVAMCTFNGARFLNAQLESIARQRTVPLEVVICDDGSTDGTLQALEAFAPSAPFPTRILRNANRLGSTRNFEKAISLCKGTIVALADQDDVWYSHKLERIESAFLQSPQIVAAFSDADLIDHSSQTLNARLWTSNGFDPGKQKQFSNGGCLDILIRHPVVTGATLAFRRECFSLMTPIPANEIHDRWMSFLLAATGRLEAIAEPLMQYRRHLGQQIGPGPVTFREQIEIARGRKTAFYRDEVRRFYQLYDRVREHKGDFPNANTVLHKLREKIAHSEHRANLPRSSLARVSRVFREVLTGNYSRYSGGWKSIAKDLVI